MTVLVDLPGIFRLYIDPGMSDRLDSLRLTCPATTLTGRRPGRSKGVKRSRRGPDREGDVCKVPVRSSPGPVRHMTGDETVGGTVG